MFLTMRTTLDIGEDVLQACLADVPEPLALL